GCCFFGDVFPYIVLFILKSPVFTFSTSTGVGLTSSVSSSASSSPPHAAIIKISLKQAIKTSLRIPCPPIILLFLHFINNSIFSYHSMLILNIIRFFVFFLYNDSCYVVLFFHSQ